MSDTYPQEPNGQYSPKPSCSSGCLFALSLIPGTIVGFIFAINISMLFSGIELPVGFVLMVFLLISSVNLDRNYQLAFLSRYALGLIFGIGFGGLLYTICGPHR